MAAAAKKELILEGLNCASCSAKIEREVNEIDGISASMNFVTKTLTIEGSSKDLEGVYEKVNKIVLKHEPHVRVIDKSNTSVDHDKGHHGHDHYHSHGNASFKGAMVQIALSLILFIIGIISDLSYPLNLLVFLVSYLIVGSSILLRAVENIKRGQVFDENFLMTIATIGAFLIGEYPEAVAVMLFYQLGELFQDIAVDRSRRSITSLMDIKPDFANLKVGENIVKVSPEEVKVGDIIVVKPGEKIPLDGKVIEGYSTADTSALTGESIPRDLEPGSDALSGFINNNGLLTLEVTKAYRESTVAKILDLVENASSRKAPTEKFITKFARYYTPVVVFLALGIALIPPLVLEGARFSDWIYRALIFLVISCPCALVISIPLSFFGGIGGASRKGILVKGSNFLEALNYVETVVFDKTGTLTKGVFNVSSVNPSAELTKEELLEYAAYAESFSNHPIASSILKEYGQEVDKAKIEEYDEIPGHGIRAKVNGKVVLAGNNKLMERENIIYPALEAHGSIVHVAVGNKYAGYIIISDEVKGDSKRAIKELKDLGIKENIMLTGDMRAVGERVGKELELDKVYSELLPQHKVEKLEEIDREKSPKGKLIYVGDGINDAPVLARADIGIAMGALGSDAAIEAADVVIMTDETSKIATAIKIARKTQKIVWQNITFALGIKILFLSLGALGVATMWEAVFADVGVAIIAILNAMRVMNVKTIDN
ncbi:MAG: cadmium-translocating P-type ATPase [Tissierellia bacterium]|nr:cadmium-translocating P-type ATPase [Tissierellia bacterium]